MQPSIRAAAPILGLILVSCGRGMLGPAVPVASSTAHSAVPATATLTLTVPVRASAGTVRRPRYVSPATQSIAISVNGGAAVAQTIAVGGPGCTTPSVLSAYTCTISIPAPIGTDTFAFATYDQPNSGGPPFAGNVLSQTATTQTIVAGANNVITATLGGVPTAIVVAPLPNQPLLLGSGTRFTLFGTGVQSVTVNALDADGNVIVGTGAPTVTVTGSANVTVTPATSGAPNVFGLTAAAMDQSGTVTIAATPPAGTGAVAITANVQIATRHRVLYVAYAESIAEFFDGHLTPDLVVPVPALLSSNGVWGLAASPNGMLFANDSVGNAVAVDTKTGAELYQLSGSFQGRPCAGADGTVYELNTSGNSVSAFPPGNENASLTYTTNISSPQACAVGADDSLWVLNGSSIVTRFPSQSTTPLGTYVVTPGALALAIDRNGTLYAAAVRAGSAIFFYPGAASAGPGTLVSSGSIAVPRNLTSAYPIQIAVDPLLNLYAATKDTVAYTTPASLTPSWASTAPVSYWATGVATVP